MGYFKDTIKGISWMGTLRVYTRLIALIKISVLAHLLAPFEFGLFGIATLVLAFLEIITETGINIFLIQEKDDVRRYNNTAWVVSILRGFLISLFIIISAPFVSSFFKSPESYRILLLISLVPFIRGFINPAIINFQKELLFAKEFLLRSTIYSLDALTAIAFALKYHSAISFIFGLIVGALVEVTASFIFIKVKPKFEFDLKKLKLVISRGKWVTLAGFFNYIFENLNSGAVGRFLDVVSLGYFQMAYKIASLPTTEIGDVVQKVTFPVYSKISDDNARLKKAFTRSILGTLFLVLPFGLILFFFPGQIINIILGEKWMGIIGLVKVMAFYGVARALIVSTYPLFLALKRQKYITAITAVSAIGLAVAIVPLVKIYGSVGAAISSLIGLALAIPITLILLNKIFKK